MYKVKTTVRKALGAAPEGMCVGISDYSAQEVRTIACIAKIGKMIDAFFDAEIYNPYLINPHNNEKYENPKGDLHVLSAQALYPELQQVDGWNLIKESKKDLGGWNRRQRGKICGFTVIYGGSANRISTALQVDKELAQQLLDNYFKLFPELKVYIDNISTLVKYQGWVECPVTNRRYWCKEDNAKGLGDDNSASRKGCNTLIQGISALMTKRAAYYVDQKFESLNNKYKCNSRIVGLVHDEIITYIEGKPILIDLKEFKGEWIPSFEYPEISYEYAKAQESGMKKAMEELLHPLVPDFPAKADCALGTSWADK